MAESENSRPAKTNHANAIENIKQQATVTPPDVRKDGAAR
jgi:hypothetical protein